MSFSGRSRTLPLDGRARSFDRNASAKVQMKNTPAHTAVERDKKFALPVAPNKLPDAPLPNDAPMSAPLPCCTSTRPIITSAARTCSITTTLNNQFIALGSRKFVGRPAQPAARQMAAKSATLRDAPPINPPSMSGCEKSVAALSGLTLPP